MDLGLMNAVGTGLNSYANAKQYQNERADRQTALKRSAYLDALKAKESGYELDTESGEFTPTAETQARQQDLKDSYDVNSQKSQQSMATLNALSKKSGLNVQYNPMSYMESQKAIENITPAVKGEFGLLGHQAGGGMGQARTVANGMRAIKEFNNDSGIKASKSAITNIEGANAILDSDVPLTPSRLTDAQDRLASTALNNSGHLSNYAQMKQNMDTIGSKWASMKGKFGAQDDLRKDPSTAPLIQTLRGSLEDMANAHNENIGAKSDELNDEYSPLFQGNPAATGAIKTANTINHDYRGYRKTHKDRGAKGKIGGVLPDQETQPATAAAPEQSAQPPTAMSAKVIPVGGTKKLNDGTVVQKQKDGTWLPVQQ